MAESRDIYTAPIEETMNPDGGKEEKKEDPIPLSPSSVAADKELSVSETKSRNDDSIQVEHIGLTLIDRLNYNPTDPTDPTELQFLFTKTLLNPKSLVLNIPDKIALAYFPTIELVANEFGDAEWVWVEDLQQSETTMGMQFFYCSIHKSHAIGGNWKRFVTSRNLEAGDVLHFYKEKYATKKFYIVRLTKKYGYGLVLLFGKQLTDRDVSTGSLQLPDLEGDKYFSCVKNEEDHEILVSDSQKGHWTMNIKCFAIAMMDVYLIGGGWSDFVSAHDLKATDVIHFYKVLEYDQNERQCKVEERDWNDRHYLIDYVRATEAAETSERGGCCGNCFSHSERQSSYAMF